MFLAPIAAEKNDESGSLICRFGNQLAWLNKFYSITIYREFIFDCCTICKNIDQYPAFDTLNEHNNLIIFFIA